MMHLETFPGIPSGTVFERTFGKTDKNATHVMPLKAFGIYGTSKTWQTRRAATEKLILCKFHRPSGCAAVLCH
jgi:hypothetical protein